MELPCQCQHKYQDELYGKGMRVHNACAKGYRCTVCGNVTNAGNQSKKDEEKKEAK